MKPRTLLILLVVVLGLGSFIWFYEIKLPSSEERAAQEKKVLELEKAEVTGVTIDSKVGTVHLERIPAAKKKDEKDKKEAKEEEDETAEPVEWRMTRPLAA